MISILLNILLIIILGIIQISFLTTWLFPVNGLNLILSLVIFVTVILSYQRGLWWGLGGGIFLELYSNLAFGVVTVSLMLTVILLNLLFNNFFTNRSFYSLLILGFIGTISYNFLIVLLNLLTIIIGFDAISINFNFWTYFFWQPFLNLIILTIIFFTYHISTGRLRNIFLSHPFYEA
ncbi:MAG: hypothetical protein CMI53_00310 [Parcubacteria group bacterium]|jgi:hypothetical protein|nr:hypothetical protein [Parcubacteria group bacterium]|tara:strand:- start:12535 stop:13068 length:534 start_codon:yes stop_codon:yes gene_type:complete